jgi:hypothetical protein
MTDSDLSQRDVAEMTQYGPGGVLDRFRTDAYDETVNTWVDQRPEDTERLEEADAFDWTNAYFEVVNGRDGPEFEIISGVPHDPGNDEREALSDLAWEFVADWLTQYVESIQQTQAESLFSRQELRVYWALANWSKKDIKTMLDVSYPTVTGYEERANDDIDRAKATLNLTYDE